MPKAPKKVKLERTTQIVSDDDLKILKERGFVPGNPHTIPDNVGPAVKAELAAMEADPLD